VYEDFGGDIDKRWYRIKNGEEVMKLEICSGDTINIDGIGKLEVYGVYYKKDTESKNAYHSLEITCGRVV
jgi:hypothetical protein